MVARGAAGRLVFFYVLLFGGGVEISKKTVVRIT